MSAIQSALDTMLYNWSNTNSVSVAWQNVDFDNTNISQYAQAFMIPAQTFPIALADLSSSDFTGIYQINVYTKKGIGTKTNRDLTESLLTAFGKGSGANGVRILQASMSGAIDDDAWLVVPISVRYRMLGV